VIGDAHGIFLPDLSRYRTSVSRLLGLRLIHTHLKNEPLNRDDLTDLALLRLDLIAAVTIGERGLPGKIHWAHLMPGSIREKPWKISEPVSAHRFSLDFSIWVRELENRLSRSQAKNRVRERKDRAILVQVITGSHHAAQSSLEELRELASTDGIQVLDTALQRLPRIHPRFVMGQGKLKEILISARQVGADLIIFNQELTPSQARSIANLSDMRVIDRTQLILDIFAQHAMSRDGKLRVELAQLKYLLPRLGERDSGLSRLTGGIGGRGPGETKLEISRRRIRERIHRLERELKRMGRGREQRRARRIRRELPVVSIVGYTNAGKSTLLNSLTGSFVPVEDKLFATLDTSTRRLRFSAEREVVVTDTVGFIRDMPRDLFGAFRGTLGELRDADLVLHVVDISNPQFEDHIREVEKILDDLDLGVLPMLLIFNKVDRMKEEHVVLLCRRYNAIPVSAVQKTGLSRVAEAIQDFLWGERGLKRIRKVV